MKVSPRVHLKQSDPFCDQPRVVDLGRKLHRPVDINGVAGAKHDFCLHWVDGPARNGYRYIWTGKRNRLGREIRRPLTKAELGRPVDQWDSTSVVRWRKTLEPVGPRRENKVAKAKRKMRPHTVAEMSRYAKRRGVTIGFELKSRAYGTRSDIAERFVAAARSGGARFFVMTLSNMAEWRGKMINFRNLSVETLILTRGRRPSDWERIAPYITHKGAWR